MLSHNQDFFHFQGPFLRWLEGGKTLLILKFLTSIISSCPDKYHLEFDLSVSKSFHLSAAELVHFCSWRLPVRLQRMRANSFRHIVGSMGHLTWRMVGSGGSCAGQLSCSRRQQLYGSSFTGEIPFHFDLACLLASLSWSCERKALGPLSVGSVKGLTGRCFECKYYYRCARR